MSQVERLARTGLRMDGAAGENGELLSLRDHEDGDDGEGGAGGAPDTHNGAHDGLESVKDTKGGSARKRSSLGASDNCCDKFLKCLGLVPCPTLLSWIVLLLGVGCLTGSLLIATWRTRDLLEDDDLLWFMEYTIIGVVSGMFVVGTLLLVASHLSSEPTSRRVFNSFSKNRCAQGLNIFNLVLSYLLAIGWVLATVILALPVLMIINIVYCTDFETLDLNYYGYNGTFTGQELTDFKSKAEELLISFGVALGAAILIVNSLICYIICLSSNIAHLRDNRFATLNAYGPQYTEEVGNSKHSVVDTNM